MVRFTVFGIPVEIQPWFWVVTAFIGGAADAGDRAAFQGLIIFMVIATFSILVHEFGHALTGRRLGGGRARIVLWSFGGLAFNEGGRFTRSGHFWRIAAGPGAGFALALLTAAGLAVVYGVRDGLNIASFLTFQRFLWQPDAGFFAFFKDNLPPTIQLIHNLLWINVWWGVLNLLPILPLDGGRLADLFVKPQRNVYLIGAITGVVAALFAWLGLHSGYTTLMFGYLAYRNYQDMGANRWS